MAGENTLEIIARLQADASSFGADINRARQELQKLGVSAQGVGREVDRGVDGAGDAIEDLGRAADKTGEKVSEVGKKSRDGFRDVEDGAQGAGVGLGALDAKALAFLGRFIGPAALGAAALKFFQDINAEAQRGAEHLQQMVDVTKRIVQVSPTKADLTRLDKQITQTVEGGVFTEQEAGQFVFDVQSQLAPTVGTEQAAQDATDFARASWFMDARALPETYGTYLGNYDKEDVGTGRQFTNKMIAAAEQSSTSVEGFAPAARGAVLGKQVGISFDEQLAGAAAVSQAYGGRMEQVATGQAAIGAIAEREGIQSEDGTWEGFIAAIEARDAEIKRNMAAVNAQTAALERQAQALEAQQKQLETAARQIQRQREDSDRGETGPLSESEQRKRTQEDRQLEDAMLANRERQAALRERQRAVGDGKEERKTWAELMQGEREGNLYWMRLQQNREKTQKIGQMVTAAGAAAPGADALSNRVERVKQSRAFEPLVEQNLDNQTAMWESRTGASRAETAANIREKAENLDTLKRTEAAVDQGITGPGMASFERGVGKVGNWVERTVLPDSIYGGQMTPAQARYYEETFGVQPNIVPPEDRKWWQDSVAPVYENQQVGWNDRSDDSRLVLGNRAYPVQQSQPVQQDSRNVANNITVNIQSVNNQVDVDQMADQLGQAVARNQ